MSARKRTLDSPECGYPGQVAGTGQDDARADSYGRVIQGPFFADQSDLQPPGTTATSDRRAVLLRHRRGLTSTFRFDPVNLTGNWKIILSNNQAARFTSTAPGVKTEIAINFDQTPAGALISPPNQPVPLSYDTACGAPPFGYWWLQGGGKEISHIVAEDSRPLTT